MLKLHLEFKKTMRVESIVSGGSGGGGTSSMHSEIMEQMVKRVSRIVAAQKTSASVSTQEEFTYLLKQHQRAFLAGLTLVWVL